ncbi:MULTISPECIES: M1 family aminopeptidase [unclassified Aureispira]|uniref:M1 family aminopeptidase n=1 Tax=unclassified Aureispira TaxID=2649989 RepID=UPI000698B6D7|nr:MULTISPECIES: M1 family aminopeptidase [unclassified Aureispira]WMX12022.1 M1 family aminopeptidase [Aureispira sp. CCB-E]
MFVEFFKREISMSIKRPMIWIFFLIITLLVSGAIASDNIIIGGSVGNIYKNAPHVLTQYTIILLLICLMMPAAFFNNAALRDYNHKFNEILFSTPIQKSGYYFGRFMGALVLSIIPFLGIFVGFFLGSQIALATGSVDAERIGPIYGSAFFNNLVLFIIPNLFIAGAIIFSIANKWRNTVVSFVGALVIIVAYFASGSLASNLDNETLAALSDTFGIRTYSIDTKYATTVEKNTIGASFSWLLVVNRLIWIGIGLMVLVGSYFSFSFAEKKSTSKAKQTTNAGKTSPKSLLKPAFTTAFNRQTTWLSFISFFKLNFYSITRSTTYKVLFIFSGIMLFTSLFGGFEYYGLQSYPVTYKMLDALNGSLVVFEIIIVVFFSGELVWRDRMAKINEVIDVTPHNSIVALFARVIALVSTVSIIHFAAMIICMLYQILNGYYNLQIGLYLQMFLLKILPIFIFWSFTLVFVQILCNNLYIGYFISVILIFILELIFLMFDVQSNMVNLGATPSLTYSDMNGFGPALISILWFNLYWILLGVVLLGFGGLIWVRGASTGLSSRLKSIKKHLNPRYAIGLGIASILWIATASFVFYNTQVINEYDSSDATEKLLVNYEKNYKKYQGIPQPKITDVTYNIDIFPKSRTVLSNSKVVLTNKSHHAIDSLHFIVDEDWNMSVTVPNAKLVFEDEEIGYLIYQLDAPLAPHQTTTITVDASYVPKGFENEVSNLSVAQNGTFLNNSNILPFIGYNESIELREKYTRKKYDLGPKKYMPTLESPCSDHCMSNYLTNGGADWVNVETYISTSEDQVAIAPGTLVQETKEGGRKKYHYKVDRASQNFYSFMSAKYEIAQRNWQGIDIEIYYDKQHSYNIDMMLDAVQNSLEYFTKNFGPYYHKQARIIEFPRYSTFAQAFPGTMPYSESFGFIINLEDETDNNIINAVIAHEMAHQWWAHQVIGSSMEGSTMLSESFAEYSSLMVMKNDLKDDLRMKQFLKYNFDRYLGGRSSETRKETPLYKVQNQGYIHYGKGALILYALQDYIGEDSLNQALKEFLELYRYQDPPYPTSLDFLRLLEPKVPDSLNYLMTDWFKEITLYDYRLKEASYQKLDNGNYQVDFNIEAYKLRVDSIGTETKIDFEDWVDIGIYTDDEEKELVKVERVLFDGNDLHFSLVVDKMPVKAAIDPKRLLIERTISDNVKSVVLKE